MHLHKHCFLNKWTVCSEILNPMLFSLFYKRDPQICPTLCRLFNIFKAFFKEIGEKLSPLLSFPFLSENILWPFFVSDIRSADPQNWQCQTIIKQKQRRIPAEENLPNFSRRKSAKFRLKKIRQIPAEENSPNSGRRKSAKFSLIPNVWFGWM